MVNKFNAIKLEELLDFLIKDGIIPKDLLPSSEETFECDSLIESILKGNEFKYDAINDILYYISDTGEEVLCPDLSDGVSKSA